MKKAEADKKPETTKTATVDSSQRQMTPSRQRKPTVDAKPNPAGPKGPEPAKAAPATKTSGSSMDVPRSPFRLVAFADDKPAEKAAPTKDEKKHRSPVHVRRNSRERPADEKKPLSLPTKRSPTT